jgi:hypothetical protein
MEPAVDRRNNEAADSIHHVGYRLMGEDDDIDPIVVSSCIFMEDERSDTQADGIINRVNTNACDQCACFLG